MLENTWNVSKRKMFDLPRETHRFFIEKLSQTQHLKVFLIKRFLSFTEKIVSSKKKALKNMFHETKLDCRSVTGLNLRRIMLLMNKNHIGEISYSDANHLTYKEVPPNEEWKVGFVKDITEIKHGQVILEGFSTKELDTMLFELCTK